MRTGGTAIKGSVMKHSSCLSGSTPFINFATTAGNQYPWTSSSPHLGAYLDNQTKRGPCWLSEGQKKKKKERSGRVSFFPPHPHSFAASDIFSKGASKPTVSSAKCYLSLAHPAGDQCIRMTSFKGEVSTTAESRASPMAALRERVLGGGGCLAFLAWRPQFNDRAETSGRLISRPLRSRRAPD